MRTWAMILVSATIVLASPPAARSQAAQEDCTKHRTQKAQIACLQAAVLALRLEVQTLQMMREAELASSRRRELVEGILEAMIDRKIREAMEPKLRLLERR